MRIKRDNASFKDRERFGMMENLSLFEMVLKKSVHFFG